MSLAYQKMILAGRPLGYLPMGDVVTPLDDLTNRGNGSLSFNGSAALRSQYLINGPLLSATTGGTGASDNIILPSFFTTNADFSVEFWMRLRATDATNYRAIFSRVLDSNNTAFALVKHPGGTLALVTKNGVGTDSVIGGPPGGGAGGTLVVSKLYHVALFMPGNTAQNIKIYLNGRVATGTTTNRRNDGSVRFGMSAESFWGAANVVVGHLAAYNRELSSAEVLAHYNAGIFGSRYAFGT